jgi:hypothetical protein
LTPYLLAIIVGAIDVGFLVYLLVIIFTTEYKKGPSSKEGKKPKETKKKSTSAESTQKNESTVQGTSLFWIV